MGKVSIYKGLKERKAKLALVGLGYVGLPIAIAFSKKGFDVVGFDLNSEKVLVKLEMMKLKKIRFTIHPMKKI